MEPSRYEGLTSSKTILPLRTSIFYYKVGKITGLWCRSIARIELPACVAFLGYLIRPTMTSSSITRSEKHAHRVGTNKTSGRRYFSSSKLGSEFQNQIIIKRRLQANRRGRRRRHKIK